MGIKAGRTAAYLFSAHSTRLSMTLKLGFLITQAEDDRTPRWSVLIHRGKYKKPDGPCEVYWMEDSQPPNGFNWTRRHETRTLESIPNLIGVLHIDDLPVSVPVHVLHEIIALKCPAERDGWNSAMVVWGRTAWALRVIYYLHDSTDVHFRLPWRSRDIYMNTRERIDALKAMPRKPGRVRVIPLNPEWDTRMV
ncbi:hypothetical protein NLJ89_g6542 [Agrocybe chaxingu]|uniref:Uncharacterized protein n=1 Tax=Agrocybe chaxingu TaxID=84603 RepID=A0A9W8JYK4_9AGAR|nr:hypothetical protein NLJ89_g6542 [Agrocybe chaxingu]